MPEAQLSSLVATITTTSALPGRIPTAIPTPGTREFVVGTGGKNSHRSLGPPVANSEVRNADTFGVLKLTLHAASYDWEFVPQAGKSFTDSGSDVCR
jgi:acid phosphatase type 7